MVGTHPIDLAPREADGRRRRRTANRAVVVDALIALFDEGIYQPGADEIAARAGVSARSVFRYFDDLDDLSAAAISRLLEQARPLFETEPPAGAPLEERVARLVDARFRLFEATAAGARAARVTAHRRPPVAAQLERSRRLLRSQLRRVFAAELAGAGEPALAAVEVLLSFEGFELLRRDQRLSLARAESVARRGVLALLGPGGGTPG